MCKFYIYYNCMLPLSMLLVTWKILWHDCMFGLILFPMSLFGPWWGNCFVFMKTLFSEYLPLWWSMQQSGQETWGKPKRKLICEKLASYLRGEAIKLVGPYYWNPEKYDSSSKLWTLRLHFRISLWTISWFIITQLTQRHKFFGTSWCSSAKP